MKEPYKNFNQEASDFEAGIDCKGRRETWDAWLKKKLRKEAKVR